MPNWWTVEDRQHAADVRVTFVGDAVVFDLGVEFRGLKGAWRLVPATRIVIRCYDNGEVTLAEQETV